MSGRIIERAFGGLRLSVLIERPELLTSGQVARAAFVALSDVLEALETPAESAPLVELAPVPSSPPAPPKPKRRAAAKPKAPHVVAAAPAPRQPRPPSDVEDLEAMVRGTGVEPRGRVGAQTLAFLRDALQVPEGDLRAFVLRQPERVVASARRECGLDPDDSTLEWLGSFRRQAAETTAA